MTKLYDTIPEITESQEPRGMGFANNQLDDIHVFLMQTDICSY